MKRTLKKSVALLLTICMVLSLMPAVTLPALAADVTYDTWVGGVQVTSDNATDVLGDGKVSYTPAAGGTAAILALDNATITSGVSTSAQNYAAIYTTEALTLTLAGDNTVTDTRDDGVYATDGYAIRYGGDNSNTLTIREAVAGNGATLNVTCPNSMVGIELGSARNMTLESGEVTVSDATWFDVAADNSILIVNGGILRASDTTGITRAGIRAPSMTINGGTVIADNAGAAFVNTPDISGYEGVIVKAGADAGSAVVVSEPTDDTYKRSNYVWIGTDAPAATTYPVWIEGVQLDENYTSGAGWEYTPAVGDTAAILALNNATLTCENSAEGQRNAAIYTTAGLTITLEGTNAVNGGTVTDGLGGGIAIVDVVAGIVTIREAAPGATLSVNCGAMNCIIVEDTAMTLESGTVSLTNTNRPGIYLNGKSTSFFMTGGELTYNSNYAAFGGSGAVTVDADSGLTVKAGDTADAAVVVEEPVAETYESKYLWIGPDEQVSTPALSALTVTGTGVSALTPAFAKSVTNYSVTVPYTTETVDIAATPDTGSGVALYTQTGQTGQLGEQTLDVGTNVFTITAFRGADDEAEKLNYTVTVTRLPDVAASDLELKSFSLTPQNGGSFERNGTIDHDAGTIKVNLVDDEKAQGLLVNFETVQTDATVTYNGGAATSGTTRVTIVDSVPTVTVTYNGQSKVYTLTVTEAGAALQNYGLGVKTPNADYNMGETVTYELYVTAPIASNTKAMDIGSFQFTMSYDTNLSYGGFTPAFGADATVDNHTTDGTLTLGYVAKNAVPVPYIASENSGYVKLGDITFTVDRGIPETTTPLTDASLTAVEVTPNGYNKNNGTVTAITDTDTVSLHNNIATFVNTEYTTGAAGKAYTKFGTAGLFTDDTYATPLTEDTLPAVTANDGYRLEDGSTEHLWTVASVGDEGGHGLYAKDMLLTAMLNGGGTRFGNVTITPRTIQTFNVNFNMDETMAHMEGAAYTKDVLFDLDEFLLDSDKLPAVYMDNNNYTLAGWSTQQGGEIDITGSTRVTAEMTLYAVFAPKTHTLTIEDVGTNHVTETGITNGQTITYNTPVVFTLASEDAAEYVITKMEYKVGSGNYVEILAGEGGAYTIPGDQITGDITLKITTNHYHTLTFAKGAGVTDTTFKDDATPANIYAALYVKDGVAGLYSDPACTAPVTIVHPAVGTTEANGQRYRDFKETDSYWSDGAESYTLAELSEAAFTADKALTAAAVKQYEITFNIGTISAGVYGANFGMDEQTPIRTTSEWYDEGATFAFPEVTTEPGFTKGSWSPELTAATEVKTYIYTANHDTFAVTFDETAVTYSDKTGLLNDSATHGTDVTFKAAVKPVENSGYHLVRVDYTIGEVTKTAALDNGVYTIPGNEIVGAVTVTPVYVHYVTVTLIPGEGAIFNGDTEQRSITAYAKYNSTDGLFTDTACETEFNGFPTVTAKDNYSLNRAPQYWIVSGEQDPFYGNDYNAGHQKITKNTTYTVDVYKTVTINIAEYDFNTGVVRNCADKVLTFTPDKVLGGSDIGYTFGSYNEEAKEHYTYNGWRHDNGTPDNSADDVWLTHAQLAAKNITLPWLETGSYTFYVLFDADTFDWYAPAFTNAGYDTSYSEDGFDGVDTTNPQAGTYKDGAVYNQPITFKLTANDGTAIRDAGGVSYTVNNGTSTPLTPDGDGLYTIPGTAILGDIRLSVNATEYVTVTFAAGTGNTLPQEADIEAIAQKGAASILYADLPAFIAGTTGYTAPVPEVSTGYRLKNRVNEELWLGGNSVGYTAAQLNAAAAALVFNADTTLTAQSVKQWTVTFQKSDEFGEHGALVMSTPTLFDENSVLTMNDIPAATPDNGYDLVWSPNDPLGARITGDITFTASFTAKTYKWYDPTFTNADYDTSYSTDGFDGVNTTTYNADGYYEGGAVYGQDITFKLEPTSANAVFRVDGVRYTVDGVYQEALTPNAEGVYTIPGTAITGDIRLIVNATEYVTVSFQQGTGNTLTPATAYAVKGTAGLYETMAKFIAGTAGYTVPVPTASTGYRLLTNAGESLWSDGTNGYTSAVLNATPAAVIFNKNTTLIAQSMKQWTVKFEHGDNGTLVGTASITVDNNYALSAGDIPAPTPSAGYVFDKWNGALDTLVGETITNTVTYTASFKHGTYDITLDGGSVATMTPGEGIAEGKVTHGTGATFTVAQNTGKRITSVKYKVGSAEPVELGTAAGTYTIPGNAITADVTVTVTSIDTFTVTFNAGSNGSVGGTTSFVVDTGSKLTQANLDAVTKAPATGYEFKQWRLDAIDGAVMTEAQILAASVTADVTYVAEFALAERTITDTNSVIASATGKTESGNATYGTDVVITLASDKIVTGVTYKVQTGEDTWSDPVAAAFDPETGTYTIPGNAITGNIEVIGSVLEGVTMEFIARSEYKAITAETLGRKILVLNGASENSTYKLADGTTLYWSSKYNAAVCWVLDEATASSLARGMTVTGTAATVIGYTGDINRDGKVTAADAGIISDCLHDQRLVPTSAMQLFMLDVESTGSTKGANGYKQVTAADITWTLTKAVS